MTTAERLSVIRARHRKLEGAAGRPAPLIGRPEKKEIESEILAGKPFAEIAKRHGISMRRLHGMASKILPELLDKAGVDRTWTKPAERTCAWCTAPFTVKRSNKTQMYCGLSCSSKATAKARFSARARPG